MTHDTLTVEGDPQEGEALLQLCMHNGLRLSPSPPLAELRQRATSELARLPEHLRRLRADPPYPVSIAPALQDLAKAVDRQNL